jgi:2-C-methyl-D-erythritol 2,4-cyclodiphosphate synthase
VGIGYDVHRLSSGRKLILGGVEIEYHKGLMGHSDADVLTHAICDALLGAAALGDIGKHFPDTDDSYKGVSSLVLLKKTKELVNQSGYTLGNIDATIVLEEPKVSSYIPGMRQRISSILGCDEGLVSIKATTTEGMGFTGTGEGISAYAIALINSK